MAAPLRVMRKTGYHGHFIGKQVIMVTLSENRLSWSFYRKTGHHGHFIIKQAIVVILSENGPS
jgi:hypothetical protein